MATEKKTVHDFEFVGRLINIMKILQEETDEFNTITQSEILELLRDRDCACSERTLTDYLKTIMKELNPEDIDGYVFENATIEDYVIIAKGLEEKLKARDCGLTTEGSKKLQLRSLRYNQVLSFAELNQVIESRINDEINNYLLYKIDFENINVNLENCYDYSYIEQSIIDDIQSLNNKSNTNGESSESYSIHDIFSQDYNLED